MRHVPQHKPDYLLLALVALLIAVGLLAVYSATFGIALAEYGDVTYYFWRQSAWAGFGIILMLGALGIDFRVWRRLSPYLLIIGIAALVAVLTPMLGMSAYGANRWLRLPPPLMPLQPSEFVKLAMILYLSTWLTGREDKPKSLTSDVVPFVLLVGLVGMLIMRQPDMGTTLVISLTAFAMFFLAGAHLGHVALLVVAGGAAGLGLIAIAGYRQERLSSFLNFGQDLRGVDFHINQALIGIGSGGLFGRGIGASRQKFFYLPDSHTDSIFAIIAEELGFVGAIVVVLLLGAVVWRGFKIAAESTDRFGYLVACGTSCWVAFQSIINIGGITGSIPLTGITLPFISSGGSSLAALMTAVGILLSISRYRVAVSAARTGSETPERRALTGLGWRRS